jgi:hypothetical protein
MNQLRLAWFATGALFTETKGINDPGLIKDDSFVLIASLSGPNDLDEEICSLIGCYGGQASDFSQWCHTLFIAETVYEFHKFPTENPGLLYLDHFISIISSLWIPPLGTKYPGKTKFM